MGAGETREVEAEISTYWLKAVLESGERVTPDGAMALYVGGHQPDRLSTALSGTDCLKIML